ncbi:SMP domain-containing protein, partial [Haematococcus lacustris]
MDKDAQREAKANSPEMKGKMDNAAAARIQAAEAKAHGGTVAAEGFAARAQAAAAHNEAPGKK